MFQANDESYLLQAIGQNRVILFSGAGFSTLAKNQLGGPPPVGSKLADILWRFLGYKDAYDGTSLPDMYEATLASGKPQDEIAQLLQSHYLCSSMPKEYDVIPRVNWYRLYTTNIDNLLAEVYRRSGVHLDSLSYPKDETRERDQTLERFQLIHLNGRLPCRADEITFSVRQYARRAGPHDPLYEQFVSDYATKPTIFIGTELNEPLFWQYIEARQRRAQHIASEHRPKSFLISPKISQPKRDTLKSFNITPVEGTVATFLEWVAAVLPRLPSKKEVLRATLPGLVEFLDSAEPGSKNLGELRRFATVFHLVPTELAKGGADRSLYLLGATPRWEDILRNLDAPRNITDDLERHATEFIREVKTAGAFMILGSAGCGKSTILRRLAIRLARAGQVLYLTNSEEALPPHVVARTLENLQKRAILLFDNAEAILGGLPALLNELRKLSKPPLLIVATRASEYDRKISSMASEAHVTEFPVPHLTRPEIEGVIRSLETHNVLGKLRGMTPAQRVAEFEVRANKQILVAMREATSGEKFDHIIRDEFVHVEPREARVLYLCVALATDAGYRLTRQEFVGCSAVDPAEALYILDRTLRDIVIPSGPNNDLLLLRHRLIAEFMVDGAAPRPLLREAYLRLLEVLSTQIKGAAWRSRVFGFYRDIINHYTIYQRFEEDVDEARSIYDALSDRFASDSQFWLQYGSLELEAGNLEFAHNYLQQADSLEPGNNFIINATGHLLFRKAIQAPGKATAIKYRDEGTQILVGQIAKIGVNDPYAAHIYCSQRLTWIRRWAEGREEKLRELEPLREVVKAGVKSHPGNKKLRDTAKEIEEEYLSQAVK